MSADSCLSVWILGDQLLAQHPALLAAEKDAPRDHIRVLLIESRCRTTRMNYHRKKLALLFSAMRHYALDLAAEATRIPPRAVAAVD